MEIPTGILRRRVEALFGRVASWGASVINGRKLNIKWAHCANAGGTAGFDFINISSRKLLFGSFRGFLHFKMKEGFFKLRTHPAGS
jgi:hypothetical protein